MSTKVDFDAVQAVKTDLQKLRLEVFNIMNRPGLDPQTQRSIRLFYDALAPHENDLTDLLTCFVSLFGKP